MTGAASDDVFPDRSMEFRDKIAWMLETQGWAVVPMAAQLDVEPPFPGYTYTVGLESSFGFPEVVVFGLKPADARGLLGMVVDLLRDGVQVPVGPLFAGPPRPRPALGVAPAGGRRVERPVRRGDRLVRRRALPRRPAGLPGPATAGCRGNPASIAIGPLSQPVIGSLDHLDDGLTLAPAYGRLASTAATTLSSSGVIIGEKRAAISPSGDEEELLEVPADVARVAVGVGRLGQLGVERVAARPVDLELLEHRERDAVAHRAERLDLLGRARLLAAELVAREPEHLEALLGVALVHRLEGGVLRRQPALRGDVDDEEGLAGMVGGGWSARPGAWSARCRRGSCVRACHLPTTAGRFPGPRTGEATRRRLVDREAEAAGDHQALDLARALADLEDLGVAVEAGRPVSRP